MATKQAVSVYIITLNEAGNLRRLLPQLADFDEVVIVDSGSEDDTGVVARSFANVRFTSHPWQGFGAQKAYALSLCRNEWVLNLDADEALTDAYRQALVDTVTANREDALESRRILLRWGKKPRSFIRDDVLVRLFRKSCGRYTDVRVHERIVINGRVRSTRAAILHHEDLGFSRRIQKSNQYSQLKALDKYARGRRCTVLHLVLAFPVALLQCYVLKGCFLDGAGGILTSMNHAYYNFMKYAKLWELQHNEPLRRAAEAQTSQP